ncbi:hypothetical protein JVU11DRAFT_4076 [Chiua virens]|nr:hypothetical protein JVU11DRAFT_4076 [Chiua virens]
MSSKKRHHGPSLPKSILEHIDREDTSASQGRHKNKLSRKDGRKQDRLDRKKRRADHFSTKAVPNTSVKRTSEPAHVDSPDAKRRKHVHVVDAKESPKTRATRASPPERSDARTATKARSKPTALEKLLAQSTAKAPKATSRIPRTREEAEEDAYIAYLEDRLGYSKGSKHRKGEEADGLDDLFDFANGLDSSLLGLPDHSSADTDQAFSEGGLDDVAGDQEFPEGDEGSDVPDATDDDEVEAEEWDESNEWTGLAPNDEELPQRDPAEDKDVEESQARPSGRYIPPSLRKASGEGEGEGEDMVKLARQLKGLINRMSEQNMTSVLDSVEKVYRKHRRHDVTSALTTLMIDGISSHAMLLDSFVVLHAAFISSLHRLIGVEFAAFVVQNIVSAYERHLREYENVVPDATQSEERGKECSNLIVLLSELYNFQVISCILLYDIIKDLLGKTLSEFRVELLLKILRSSGQQLRQDDPSALKDIVTLAQSSIANQTNNLSSRVKFMIETLTNLKNNKIKESATQHQGGDAVERMKKFLSGLGKKRHVQAHEALRVSLSDLRSAETKGKWWLVGAAWGGDPLVDQQQDASARQNEGGAEDIGNTALVKLARKQGMNTDIRRSVFVVLMSSDDYLDACERLAQLNLTEVQQREIVRVVLHCCGNEKSYNPYYALVCQQLCQRSHAYKITLQFCLWDFLRDLGESNVGGAEVVKSLNDEGRFELKMISSSRIKNVAKGYGWWIAKDCCPITILKPVDFTIIKPQTLKFLRELFVQIFVASQVSSPILADDANINDQSSRNRGAVEEIFLKATKIETLGLGLIFFLSNAFKGEEGLLKWASGVAKETLQTGMNEIPRL